MYTSKLKIKTSSCSERPKESLLMAGSLILSGNHRAVPYRRAGHRKSPPKLSSIIQYSYDSRQNME